MGVNNENAKGLFFRLRDRNKRRSLRGLRGTREGHANVTKAITGKGEAKHREKENSIWIKTLFPCAFCLLRLM